LQQGSGGRGGHAPCESASTSPPPWDPSQRSGRETRPSLRDEKRTRRRGRFRRCAVAFAVRPFKLLL
jgi:hypothetical protein